MNNSIEWGNPEDIDFYGLIEYRGGANADPLTIANCTFTDNTIGGNSVFFKYTQEREGLGPHFYNTILDIPEENAFGFAYNGEDEGGTPPTLNDLVFQNCLTNLESLGGNAANKDNQVRVTNFGFAGEGNYSLIDESPAIDAGNNDLYKAIGGDLYKDVDLTGEQLRWLGKSIDIGAYESFGETPTPPSDTTFHNLTLEVAPGIELYNLSAGEHLVEAGGHLHLQFLPEDRTLGADDILLLIDGVETEFKDFGANLYFSYILNPVKQNHSVVIALREYTVTLPEVQGITYDVGAGMHRVAYGNSFTFRLTLADEIDPADVHVFANGQEISPTNLPQGEALRSEAREGASLSYTIDRVTTPVIVRIEGGSTTSNASLTQGVRLAIDNGQLTIDNEMANAVDVAIYSITGQNMVQLRGLRGSRTLTLPAGIYIVRAGQQSWKVIING
ncbi:T9SS type A sorting domain-containing protein [Parabacteroides sp. PF5-6]|uniref:T9SS type A sorting domain-containing protein n=1 Tax=Parabacteroides sp. PF5-6 TaxID=1742403 RepID=UPI002405D97D|nr:T9SS type A sorting domain-containing protein [Parabacteroides sp. PF5-6]